MKTSVQIAALMAMLSALATHGEIVRAKLPIDSRIQVLSYSDAQIYRLRGYVGYQIDVQFEAGESFVGLGAGDIEALSFAAQDNHLFLKPKAATVGTNLTVLTNRRQYQFDYTAADHRIGPRAAGIVYAVRFIYPPTLESATAAEAAHIDRQLDDATTHRSRNVNYWYCGSPALQPIAASDDGVHTRLRFGARNELPAIFVRDEDGGESLLNFNMDAGDVVVHRVARGFVVRRGALTGCIVNKGFVGSGERLESATVSPEVERLTPGARP